MIHEKDIEREQVDVVCGMHCKRFPHVKPIRVDYEGREFIFCGDGCHERFKENPKRYMGEPLMHIVGVNKIFRNGDAETHVLKGIDLHIWEGDFISIIGASGSGKSTLLNIFGLLDRPTSGQLFIRGKDVSKFSDIERALFRSKMFGFVFQQYNLIPWLTAYENATIPNIFGGKKPDRQALLKYFEFMGIKNRSHHLPAQMSGGEQQRVALIRAIANDPIIILGDEPTGNLDSKTGEKLLDMLIDLKKRFNKTLIIVTHDRDIAEMADEIITLKDGEVVPDSMVHKKTYTE